MSQQPTTGTDVVHHSNKSNLFFSDAFPSVGVWKKHGFLLLSGSTVSLRVEVWMSLTLQDNDLLALITFLGVTVRVHIAHNGLKTGTKRTATLRILTEVKTLSDSIFPY